MQADITVAGGGIIGMSIAWRLAQQRCRVTVLDAGRIGGEASWAGAGMLAPGGEIEVPSAWASMAMESHAMYAAFVAELSEESGVAIDFRRSGAIERALSDEAAAELRARAEKQGALGIPSKRISDREIFFPDDCVVDPRDIMRALRGACEKRGVSLRENHPVRSLDGSATYVLAAGAWSGGIQTPRPIPPSIPVRGHLVAYQMEPASLGPILRSADTYILQRASGFTIAGSSIEHAGFDRRLDAGVIADIDRRARVLMPQLGARVDAWLGFRPATEDLQPRIGRLEDTNIFLAYGHYRNGILLAPVTAERIARAITASSETDSVSPAECLR